MKNQREEKLWKNPWATQQWKDFRSSVIQDQCETCGNREKLRIHHTKQPKRPTNQEELNDYCKDKDIVTICARCHYALHKGYKVCPACKKRMISKKYDVCFCCKMDTARCICGQKAITQYSGCTWCKDCLCRDRKVFLESTPIDTILHEMTFGDPVEFCLSDEHSFDYQTHEGDSDLVILKSCNCGKHFFAFHRTVKVRIVGKDMFPD